jgi:heme/copper-type cytochrome/quinol oxidase subunit 2
LFDWEQGSLHGGQMMAQRANPQDEKRRSPLDGILVILITVILSVVLVAMLLNVFMIVI